MIRSIHGSNPLTAPQAHRGVGEPVTVGAREGLARGGTRIGVGTNGRAGATVGPAVRSGARTVAAGDGVRSGVRVGEIRGAVGVGEW